MKRSDEERGVHSDEDVSSGLTVVRARSGTRMEDAESQKQGRGSVPGLGASSEGAGEAGGWTGSGDADTGETSGSGETAGAVASVDTTGSSVALIVWGSCNATGQEERG